MQNKLDKNKDLNPPKRTFIEWVKEHVRPQVGLEPNPEEGNSDNTFKPSWQNVKERIRIGIGFRFKF